MGQLRSVQRHDRSTSCSVATPRRKVTAVVPIGAGDNRTLLVRHNAAEVDSRMRSPLLAASWSHNSMAIFAASLSCIGAFNESAMATDSTTNSIYMASCLINRHVPVTSRCTHPRSPEISPSYSRYRARWSGSRRDKLSSANGQQIGVDHVTSIPLSPPLAAKNQSKWSPRPLLRHRPAPTRCSETANRSLTTWAAIDAPFWRVWFPGSVGCVCSPWTRSEPDRPPSNQNHVG
ncbi:hypothetical protein Poly21_11790 [Allorhodopirellula heiligendammensis]|uniref:Uncharacterized protein n=1 Tax=Allorhodopirellula heiligendammensis TaxID=2714739 RepID=A0A5C6C4A2_9BACT|nr:hypothetical protein Poly21_11790 [Allorhodopirellula heiligendammensis]